MSVWGCDTYLYMLHSLTKKEQMDDLTENNFAFCQKNVWGCKYACEKIPHMMVMARHEREFEFVSNVGIRVMVLNDMFACA